MGRLAQTLGLMINFEVFLAAVGGTAVVAAAAGILLKSLIEKAIDHRLKLSEERIKLLLVESMRRRGKIFDLQVEPLRLITATIYEARNIARELSASTTSNPDGKEERLADLHRLLVRQLHDYRVLLPDAVFLLVHDGQYALFGYIEAARARRARHLPETADEARQRNTTRMTEEQRMPDEIVRRFHHLDGLYTSTLFKVQEHFGLQDEA